MMSHIKELISILVSTSNNLDMMTGYSLKNKKKDDEFIENEYDFELLTIVDLNY